MSDNRIYKSESSYRFGDTLNVVTKNLAMTLSATLAETLGDRKEGVSTSVVVVSCTSAYLATLSTARHCLISGC